MKSKLMVLPLLLIAVVYAAVATPAIRPQSQRGIIFPKESYDECWLDGQQQKAGSCKRLEDCPVALERWQREKKMPKTCYFVKFEQFVCCEEETKPTLPALEQRRSSVECEGSMLFGISVVGGKPTSFREFPHMAALAWPSNVAGNNLYRCGGTLIAPNFVLTAAHCINFGGQAPSMVRLGGDNLTLSMGEDYKIRRVFTHPNYDDRTAYNDIALLELEGRAPFRLRPACLWETPALPVQNLTAVGYGSTSFTGLSSAQLLKVNLQHVERTACQPFYPTDVLASGLASSQLCAGDSSGLSDTCQGDSGGPLLLSMGKTWYVVGITSIGQGCASGPPSIYTRVSSYLDWIENIVWPKDSAQLQQQPDFDLRVSS
ncbi:spirit [Drosophila busckii]|uniref:Spirit n=1 Tax=Drosophila busckii TaxID=30019 RepID=A0A0M3QZB4_DROBS|nr:serine protease snake [Drosophila busckii]ALC49079.1 spirit [Drosophila busckii]